MSQIFSVIFYMKEPDEKYISNFFRFFLLFVFMIFKIKSLSKFLKIAHKSNKMKSNEVK